MKRFQEIYNQEAVVKIKKKFTLKNNLAIPRFEKVTINIGKGEIKLDQKIKTQILAELQSITGQKPVVTLAKKAISGFKIKKNDEVGIKVTLRRQKMYDFLEKLIRVVLPRVRDFRGLNSQSFDHQGNYTLGIKEQIIFPEIEYDKVEKIYGMNITITFDKKNKEINYELLKLLGFPFKTNKSE